MSNDTFIYSLEFPEGNIRYIGKSNHPEERLLSHIEGSRNYTKTHKTAWINKLLNEGFEPILKIVDKVKKSEWQFWEQFYISLYKTYGFDLTNETLGGDGLCNPNEEIRDRISKSLKKHFQENNIWNKGKKGIGSGWVKGKKQTQEHIDKVRKTRKDKFDSGEIKIWNKGKKGVQEIWNKGKKGVMPEPWNKGIPMTEESKKKISESCKKSYENRKEIICPHCNKIGKNNRFIGSHFDNCKFKKTAL